MHYVFSRGVGVFQPLAKQMEGRVARATILIECGLTSGLGRVRRSLTLATALEKQGMDICVVLSDPEGQSLVETLGFEASFEVPADLSEDLVVVDTCSQTTDDVNAVCKAARVSLVIDDLAERPVSCDYLVNPNVYAQELDYSAYRVGQAFLGTDFTLVDARFYENASVAQLRNGTVVSFGGTDNGTFAIPVIEALLKHADAPVFVPVPDYIEPLTELEALSEASELVHLVRNADMPRLLGQAKVFVGAAGATVLEALAAGCRVCVTATQADQHRNVAHLPKVGVQSFPKYVPDAMARQAVASASEASTVVVLNRDAAANIAKTVMVGSLSA